MYIFRYKTSPFISEIIFNGLSNTEGQLLSPKETIEEKLVVFLQLESEKVEAVVTFDLELHNIGKELFHTVGKLYDCCEEWLKMIPPNLLVDLKRNFMQSSPH